MLVPSGPQECVEKNPGGTPAPQHRALVLPKSFGPAGIATARGPQDFFENYRGTTLAHDKRGSDNVRGGTDVVVYNTESYRGSARDEIGSEPPTVSKEAFMLLRITEAQLLMKEEASAPTVAVEALKLACTMMRVTEAQLPMKEGASAQMRERNLT